MTFLARTAAVIRDDLLARWAAAYRARGLDLAIDRDSDAYGQADALALNLEGLELTAQGNAHQVLIARASGSALDDFASDDGTARKPAASARRHVTVSGPTSATTSIGGAYLTSSSGLRFNAIDATGAALTSITTDGAGAAEILVECTTTGTRGNVAADTILTWSSAPTGFGGTGSVAATATNRREGVRAEADEDLKTRLLDRRRERPASGNRADWREKVREVTGVADVYVYPAARPPASYPNASTPDKPGCLTLLVIGPTSGDAPVNTRFVIGGAGSAGARCTQIEDFLEGARDATLSETTTGRQWRPVTLPQANRCAKTPLRLVVNVTVQLVLTAARPFPWTGTMSVDGTSSTTSLVVTGDQTAKSGKAALVPIGTAAIRGGMQVVTLGTGVYAAGVTTFPVTLPDGGTTLAAAPVATLLVRPAPPDWSAIRTAVFAFFDAMGPADYNLVGEITHPDSARWPTASEQGPSTLYPTALGARVLSDVPAVLSAAVTSPSSPLYPADEEMADLGYLVVTA